MSLSGPASRICKLACGCALLHDKLVLQWGVQEGTLVALRTRSRPAPAAADEDGDLAAAIAASLADAGAPPTQTIRLCCEATVCCLQHGALPQWRSTCSR